MTNQMTNHYYHHHKQEDATRATSPILLKATSHSSTTEGNSALAMSPAASTSTAPNSASSSPLSFNYSINNNNNNNNKMMAANHHPNHEACDDNTGSNNKNNTYSRGPLSPQSCPPTTSAPGGWSSANNTGSTTPVPSVIHTQEEGADVENNMTRVTFSAPYFPTMNTSSSGNMSLSTGNLISRKSTTSSKVTGKKKHHPSKQKAGNSSSLSLTSSPRPHDGGITSGFKKQRRLERNRLSAQLSRRRRKQYLEELEERVVQLSLEMDSGRRSHAFQAMDRISEMRQQVLVSAATVAQDIECSSDSDNININNGDDDKGDNKMMLQFQLDNSLRLLENDGHLSRTNSHELLVLNSFLGQQLKSFSLPSHAKFILWLTLQGDLYFRGGRAASERLSAARIGERMLISGNDKVTPANAMWPLVCNEVSLSYELEERVRHYQRTSVLQDKNTWLDRHTARSSDLVMQAYQESVGGMAQMVGRRESETIQQILTPIQRVKYLAWAGKNSVRIKARLDAKRQREGGGGGGKRGLQKQEQVMKMKIEDTDLNIVDTGKYVDSKNYELNQSYHLAANLYILNHRLQNVLKDFPCERPSSLTPAILKKLMRRASFESLGQQHKDDDGHALSREDSFASSGSFFSSASNGSLMKSSSSLSLVGSAGMVMGPEDPERAALNQITPQVGEQAAADTVEHALGFVKPIIPPIPKPMISSLSAAHLNMKGTTPTQDPTSMVTLDYHNHNYQHVVPAPVISYGHIHSSATDPPAPLASAPLSDQHTVSTPHHKEIVMHHFPPPTTQLNGQNYSAPMTTHTSSQIQHSCGNYQQPEQQPQPIQYYPPQQQIHYAPATTASANSNPQQQQQPIAHSCQAPSSALQQQQPQATKTRHVRKSSFLPPHLNVVPEDMFPGVEGTAADFFELQDCLMDDGEDWGIGVGLDMDTAA